MSQNDPLSTYLPQLDYMIQAIENGDHKSLTQHYSSLDHTLGMLYNLHIDELRYLAVDDPQNATSEEIGDLFWKLRPSVAQLHDELSLGEFSEALEHLHTLKKEMGALFTLFERYQSEWRNAPQLSDIPHTHELLRVCNHFLNGALGYDAVQGRLNSFCQFHEQLETRISTMLPSPLEQDVFEASYADLEEALSMQLQAIEDLDCALERNDRELMREAMGLLTEAAEVLVEVYLRLHRADSEPPQVNCVRCGETNSTQARMCGNCGAVIPQSTATGEPFSTIALEEDGSSVLTTESDLVSRLQDAVDKALMTSQTEELSELIDQYDDQIQRQAQRFKQLDTPPADLPADQKATLQHSHALFSAAIEELKSGLDLLRDGAASLDSALLTAGLEKLREAETLFREFIQEFERAESAVH